ncbi:3'-5' exonuclease [Streptococcus sp. A11]|uniref:3'-5' exonuclease n=1 Tax=unclassified Streptococcus TaxID=2608887 RepID=UPI00374D95A3
MENLQEYVAFDLEFNAANGAYQLIQLSAVKFVNHEEVDQFDSYVYTDVPLQSFINGLTGITVEKIKTAPKIETVLADFQAFVGQAALIGYNAMKSDLPILAENGLDLKGQYQVDLYEEALERRSTDLNSIVNLKLTSVADYLGVKGRGHNSLEDARMTAQVYEKFLEFDENQQMLGQQEVVTNNPFAGLGNLFD